MIQLYILVGAAIASALIGGTTAWKVQDWRYAAKDKERMEAAAEKRRLDAKVIDTAATGHEADKREIHTRFVTITEEVERVVEKPVYRDVCLDADGMRVLSDAIGAPDPAGQPAGALPRPEPSR